MTSRVRDRNSELNHKVTERADERARLWRRSRSQAAALEDGVGSLVPAGASIAASSLRAEYKGERYQAFLRKGGYVS